MIKKVLAGAIAAAVASLALVTTGAAAHEVAPTAGAGSEAPQEATREQSSKKNCKKIKNRKKRKKCKKRQNQPQPQPNPQPNPEPQPEPEPEPQPAGCDAYAPGEQGAEAESFVVTDAATEEAPLEVPVSLGESLGDVDLIGVLPYSNQYFNLQVDGNAAEAGLYILFEFPERRDYDLRVYWPTGEEVAASHAFQPIIEADAETPFGNLANTGGNAGESTASSEKIVGLITPDCGGYTVDAQNWLGEGGDFTIKVWLGEGVNEPVPAEG